MAKANPIAQTTTLTGTYAALSATRFLCRRVTLGCPPSNAGDVTISLDGGATGVTRPPGWWSTYDWLDLSAVQVKGTVGDELQIDGTTGGPT